MNEAKASRYQRLRRRSTGAATALAAALLVLLLVSGGAAWLRDVTGGSAAAYALALVLLIEAAVLPLVWYRTAVLERQYGLSVVAAGAWLVDHATGAAFVAAAGALGAELLYATIQAWPRAWWLAAASGGALLIAVMSAVMPVLLLPAFHRSRPLERGPLRQRLMELAGRAGVRALDVHEWMVGDTTRRATAVLAGSGPTRRILLSSSLLRDYSDAEIEAVVAHELGHHVHRDMIALLAAEYVVLLAGGLVAAAALTLAGPALGLASPADRAGLPLLVLAAGGVSLLARPALHALSRRFERRADRFALTILPAPEVLGGVVRRMAAQNMVEERPSRAARWLFHSHPPVEERIRAAR